MEVVLLAIVVFIFAIDQFSLTETIYRPIIAAPIIGIIFGDFNTGLVVGGSLELLLIGSMPVGGAQPPNAVVGSFVAMIFVVKSGLALEPALAVSAIFSVFGGYVVTATFAFMAFLMVKADKEAENANPAGITQVTIIGMSVLGGLFAALAVAAYVGGTAAADSLTAFSENFSWLMGGLTAAGGMMRFVGFAILMRIMLTADLWGFFLAGFAVANIFVNIPQVAGPGVILVAILGAAIAIYDFQTNIKMKNLVGASSGGATDGI